MARVIEAILYPNRKTIMWYAYHIYLVEYMQNWVELLSILLFIMLKQNGMISS